MATADSPHRPALTLVATGLGLFMIFLDATITNVALPAIQSDFDVGESAMQWVVAAYSLTMGMFMMTTASLADARGRRRAYVIGVVVFSGASLACGLAPNVEVLIATRGLQGVGAAIVNVASLALVGAAYPDRAAKARAVGLWTGIAAIGLAIGPTVGGVLTETVGWRWIFLVNPLVGAAAVVLALLFVSESTDPQRHSFDPLGQALFLVGIGTLTFALVQAPSYGFSSPVIIGAFVVTALVAAAFVRTELRSSDPMMDVRVFADIPYTAAILTVFSALFCAYGTLLVISQYFQNVRDYSPIETGLLMMAFSIPAMVMAPVSGRLAARFGGRRPTLVGLVLVSIAATLMAIGAGGPTAVTVAGLLFLGFGTGASITPATAVAMTSIDADRSGMASGILSVQRALGSTAGFAVMGSVLALVVSVQLPGALETLIPDADERDQVVSDIVAAANPNAVPASIGPAPAEGSVAGATTSVDRDAVIAAADGAFDDGIRLAEAIGAVLVLSVAALGWRVFPRTVGTEAAEEQAERAALDEAEGV